MTCRQRHLSAAQRDSRAELIPKALSVAEQACRVNPSLREASFNKALALEALHLSEQAATAWKQYRTLDSDSAWSREALAHLTNLEEVRIQDSTRWGGVQRALEAGLENPPDLDRLRPARQQLRTWLETTLIPAWAERTLSGDRAEARQKLDHARAAADLLARLGGDSMPQDGIRAIDDTERHHSNELTARLARAHIALREVLQDFDDGSVAEANLKFKSVEPAFVLTHSPYAHWSTIYDAVALYARATLRRGAPRVGRRHRH